MERLDEEGETSLARKLEACGTPVRLTCTNCGRAKQVEQGCRQKWCPVCSRRIAALRGERYRLAVAMMEWPLFVTLTIPHTDDPYLTQLRRLKRGFGKLRKRKIWTLRTKGGVAGVEINSESGDFHPHLHTVIDCKWLAIFVPPPQKGDSKKRIAEKCLAASQEFGLEWAKILKVTSLDPDWAGVIWKVKRCNKETIATEILKYSVKGSELLEYREPIGPVIRALQCTRLVTSFGSLYGKARVQDGTKAKARPCECGAEGCWMTEWEEDAIVRQVRERR